MSSSFKLYPTHFSQGLALLSTTSFLIILIKIRFLIEERDLVRPTSFNFQKFCTIVFISFKKSRSFHVKGSYL